MRKAESDPNQIEYRINFGEVEVDNPRRKHSALGYQTGQQFRTETPFGRRPSPYRRRPREGRHRAALRLANHNPNGICAALYGEMET